MTLLGMLGTYLLATIVQAPFLILLASPWLLAAWFLLYLTRRHAPSLARLFIAAAVAAIGLTPAYGFHLSMMPMYMIWWSGNASTTTAFTSYLLTVAVVFLFFWSAAHLRSRVRNSRPA